jgi:hypothetical protein
MKTVILCVICSIVFFVGGYAASSWFLLRSEFGNVTSSAISREFTERSTLYILSKNEQNAKVQSLLEALIFGDIVAMKIGDFSSSTSAEQLCSQLRSLEKSSSATAMFRGELLEVLPKCN